MASLSLKHVYKVYDGDTRAVSDFNMEIRDGEFIIFVGPSGCGKSTTLRMIAGLEDISAGEVRIDGTIVNDVEPGDRNIAMVFQNYALYPHMTVYENMAFSLKTARMKKEIIHEKVMEAARTLGITEYLGRKPRALSGGQRQRVALGRAIVRSPKVFLFDEPLSNLDAKLRASMRAEITRLHERLGTTFIYVTHDQVEAMTMGSRIVVMRGGVVQQIDSPKNLYNHPANLFVAGFIGTPRMNLWNATLQKEGDRVRITTEGGVGMQVDYGVLSRVQTRYMDGRHPAVVGVRPDDVRLWKEGMDPSLWAKLPVTVSVVESLGGETLIYGHIGAGVSDDQPIGESADEGESTPTRDAITLKAPADCEASRGDILYAAVSLRRLHVFDRAGEQSIAPRIPTENRSLCTVEGDLLTVASQRFPLPPALCGKIDATDTARKPSTPMELILPTDAILLGTGSGRAEVREVEVYDKDGARLSDRAESPDKTLYRLHIGGEVFFALESGKPRFAVGDSVPFDPDLSRITVEACGIFPLPFENRLDGRFVKEKEVDDTPHSPTCGRRVYRFYLDIADHPLAADKTLCDTLFACRGAKIFRTPLTYSFPASAVTLTPRADGDPATRDVLTGRVAAVLDYGRTTYASVSLGSHRIIAPYDGKVGDPVAITLDQSRLTVTDRDTGMIVI